VSFDQIKDAILNHYAYDLQMQIAKDLRAKAKIDIKPMPEEFKLPTPAEPAAPKTAAPKEEKPKN
jgi:hypothetical protein